MNLFTNKLFFFNKVDITNIADSAAPIGYEGSSITGPGLTNEHRVISASAYVLPKTGKLSAILICLFTC